MATNYVQPGRALDVTAPYEVTAGTGVAIGAMFGVASAAAANGAAVTVETEGVWNIAKNASSVFSVGQKVFFNATDKKAHSNADDDSNSGGAAQAIGYAVQAAGAGATSVRVRLVPVV